MPDQNGQRQIAGLWCGDVLARLPDLLDGALDAAELARVREHVEACAWCARFGGAYGQLVARLATVGTQAPAPIAERLKALVDGDLPAQDLDLGGGA